MTAKTQWVVVVIMVLATTCRPAERGDMAPVATRPASPARPKESTNAGASPAGRGRNRASARSAEKDGKDLTSNTLYRRYCQRCHDQDGSGARSRPTLPVIPDFRNSAWRQDQSDDELIVSIIDGKGIHMPSFGDKLGKAQALEIVALLKTLDPPARHTNLSSSEPIKSASSDFDKKFRELQEQMKSLQRQFHELSSPPARQNK